MSNTEVPSGPPPPYEAASSSATSSTIPHIATTNRTSQNFLQVPQKSRNGIPPECRRSMEDEARPLPHGWVRQFDDKVQHQFFVDTTTNPARSIWHHPYDDDKYLSTLTPEERDSIQGQHRVPTKADIAAESSDEDHDHEVPPPRPDNSQQLSGVHRFGRRMKDKLTQSTHEERERDRAQRAREEEEAYERHQMYRAAMSKAIQTGEPQLIGKDRAGKDVYIEPPPSMAPYGGGYSCGGYGYNPYTQGPYANPNVRFLRPQDPYSRPYYGGYGGGLGLPIGLGLGGGLLAGGLLGGALF